MNYDTTNLDEAAYLALQGFPFTITPTAQVAASFSFTVDEVFEVTRARFWQGEVTVELHRWLATRTGLKNATAGQRAKVKQIASPSMVPAQHDASMEQWRGFPYWFREDGRVKCNKFGNQPLHIDRFNKKNAYRSKDDALKARDPFTSVDLSRPPPPIEKEKAGGAPRSPA